ncbi:slipin family protein [Thorsellia anophelis]|uniref:SPFH domain / Band 7 family protein n=1 Tax=Thorsellia anophelis DSM 18579 TaxID=1123402 RepID=A0A1H9YTM3_9GAMM|nr:slipin family protein [Thorsellia anophelis]SES72032.1 SPFH domain / Band 7 family protein [Thorsellia anophelis DSM 18579]
MTKDRKKLTDFILHLATRYAVISIRNIIRDKIMIKTEQQHDKQTQFTQQWFGRKKLTVQPNQLALLYRNQLLENVYAQGEFQFKDSDNELNVVFVDLAAPLIDEKLANHLYAYLPEVIAKYCTEINTNENEIGLRYENGILIEILPPATKRLYWLGPTTQTLKTYCVEEAIEVDESIKRQLLRPNARAKKIVGTSHVLMANIPAYHVGILKVDGKIMPLLAAGNHAYWAVNRTIDLEIIDTRITGLEVNGQEILTKDKVTLRINLIANWQYIDVLKAHEQLSEIKPYLYRELQFSLREAIGTRTLDELLEDKEIINKIVIDRLSEVLKNSGIVVTSLGVKDIILPGEIKAILAKVVEAEKAAQANVIRRREETSATRSLLNTAKVMENNPIALRLKELETLEKVVEHIDTLSVYGGLDGVLNGLVTLNQNK